MLNLGSGNNGKFDNRKPTFNIPEPFINWPRDNKKFQLSLKVKHIRMRKVFLFLMLLPVVAFAQKKASPAPYAKSITAEELKKQLYTVAGADMQGRETATPGQKKAAAYIEDYFKSIGLQPGNKGSYQMKFPVYRNEDIKT